MPQIFHSPNGTAKGAAWSLELLRRVRTLWVPKMLVTAFGMAAFMVIYFWLLRRPFLEVTIIPATAIDRMIGVHPAALPLYFSLWFYVSLVLALVESAEEIAWYALTASLVSAVGFAIFFLWPSVIPHFDIDWPQYASLAFLKAHDLAGNSFPSMHVAFSVFTALLLEDLLRQMNTGRVIRALNWLWCIGILYSTLATVQHVVLDLVGGAVLGGIAGLLHLRMLRTREAVKSQGVPAQDAKPIYPM